MSAGTDNTALDKAFNRVQRKLFLPATKRLLAGCDRPLEIGHGQTNSQPLTVRRMLAWLAVKPGQKVLDVGSGSGWTTALLATLVGPEGCVFAVERIDELRHFGEANCQNFGCKNVSFFPAESRLGLPGFGPFDRILVSAAATGSIPQALLDQLSFGGILVIPVGNSIFEFKKPTADQTDPGYLNEHYGYSFVPLIY
jgi:protein-L-isoaspartate(D-aspartate) O-methyltransferase